MLSYRFYMLTSDGKIDTADNLDFPDDKAALEHAGKVMGDHAIEAWQGKRLVFRLAPKAA